MLYCVMTASHLPVFVYRDTFESKLGRVKIRLTSKETNLVLICSLALKAHSTEIAELAGVVQESLSIP